MKDPIRCTSECCNFVPFLDVDPDAGGESVFPMPCLNCKTGLVHRVSHEGRRAYPSPSTYHYKCDSCNELKYKAPIDPKYGWVAIHYSCNIVPNPYLMSRPDGMLYKEWLETTFKNQEEARPHAHLFSSREEARVRIREIRPPYADIWTDLPDESRTNDGNPWAGFLLQRVYRTGCPIGRRGAPGHEGVS